MFVASKQLLSKAQKKRYAIPAFNTSNLEVSKALFQAAEKAKSPLIIQTTESAIRYAGLGEIYGIASLLEKQASVPVCIHLDHGKDLKLIRKCLDIGYKSVMVDASSHSFEKNVAITKTVVGLAKRKNASVEAELGTLGKKGNAKLTDPEQARKFVEKTGCDCLAVAIGTSHGAYKFDGSPAIDLRRLAEIRGIVSVPLVLHGASSVPKQLVNKANIFGARIKGAKGVSERQLRKAVKLGVCKINIDTDLRIAFTAGLRESLHKNPEEIDPRKYLAASMAEVEGTALEKMSIFGSKSKA